MNAMLLSLLLLGQSHEFLMAGPTRSNPDEFLMGGRDARLQVLSSPSNPDDFLMGGHSKRLLDLYGPSWCPHCPKAETEVTALKDEFEVRIHADDSKYPKWVTAQAAKDGWGYPLAHWAMRDESGKVMVWGGVEAFREADAKPKAVADAASAPTPYAEVVRVLALLPQPQVGFVDFGCGADARWCLAAAERWPEARITGVEIDPLRAAAARERVREAGLEDRVTILEGDVLTAPVQADVFSCYLYPGLLEQLKPRLETMRAGASYLHRPQGLSVVQNGDSWLYFKPVQQRTAVWGGLQYTGPVCSNSRCSMCNAIRRMLAN